MPTPPLLLALAAGAALSFPADDEAPVARPAPLEAAALEAALLELAQDHPRFTRVLTRGEGVGLPLLVIRDDADTSQPPLGAQGPTGLLLVGGLDARRATDAEVLLGVARRLLERPEDELLAALGDHQLVFMPRVDLAGTDASLGVSGGPRREQAGNGAPDDADRDGRIDEDGPDDLDGDGRITWMRIPDGTGEWVVDEHDLRALRQAKRGEGERGTHRVEREGHDNDGDGDSGEDGADGVQLDRNFPHGWAEHDAAAGRFPLSEGATAELARVVRLNPQLVGVLVVGDQDTLVSLPEKAKRVERSRWGSGFSAPLDGLLEADLDTLGEFQRRFGAALDDGEKHAVKAGSMLDGSFLAWAYHHAGRWPLAVKTWAPPTELPKAEAEDTAPDGDDEPGDADADADNGEDQDAVDDDPNVDEDADESSAPPVAEDAAATEAAAPEDAADAAEAGADADADAEADAEAEDTDKPTSDPDSPAPAAVLAWLDERGDTDGFVPWTAFEHPEHGPVEIGGLAPGVTYDAPVEAVDALAERLAAFTLDVLAALPALAFEDVEVEARGAGAYVVSAALVNTGALPTAPQFAADAGTSRPIRVTLDLPDGAARLNGPQQVLVPRLEGAGGRQQLRWVVAAPPGTTLTLHADADSVADIATEVLLP